MIDHLKASTRSQVETNAATSTATACELKKSSHQELSIKSLSKSKGNRCVVCYKLLHTWKGSKLCRYYDVNSEIGGKRQRPGRQLPDQQVSGEVKVKPELAAVEEVAQAVGGRLRSKKIENKNNAGGSVDDGSSSSRKNRGDDQADVNLVNGEVNHHGDSNTNNNFVSSSSSHKASSKVSSYNNNKYTIGDLITKTLSLKSASPDNRASQEDVPMRSGKICDCCLDNLSLIDYHMNHSSQLKAKMMRKFKFTNKFHSNRFTLSRKCLTKRLRVRKLTKSRFSSNRLNGYRRPYLESDSRKMTDSAASSSSSLQLDHDKIDKLNSLLENVSLIASAILNNSKANAKSDSRNGLVVDDNNNSSSSIQERPQVVKTKPTSAPVVNRNHHQHHDARSQQHATAVTANQPRIIESNELINNLNKLGNQQSSARNNNRIGDNPLIAKPFKGADANMLLTLAAALAMNNGQTLKLNGLNLNSQNLANGNLLGQDQFGDQQQSNSSSPQETNRRKRKSINPSRLPKLGKFDEPFKVQNRKGAEEPAAEEDDEDNESDEENEDDQEANHADTKPSRDLKDAQDNLNGQKRPINKSTSGSSLNSKPAVVGRNRPFQKPQPSFSTKPAAANGRKGFMVKQGGSAENGNGVGIVYNENVLEDNENLNNEYVDDGGHDDGALDHDLTLNNNHYEDDQVNRDEDNNENQEETSVYNGYDGFNDENDEEAELYQNNNSQEYADQENDDDDENIEEGAEGLAYEENFNNQDLGTIVEPEGHDIEEQSLNNEIRKINGKPTTTNNNRQSKTIANAKFSAVKQPPPQTTRNAKPVPQKMVANIKKPNLPLNSASFKPIATPVIGLNASLGQAKAGVSSRPVHNNNNQNKQGGKINIVSLTKNGNQPAAVNNKNKPIQSAKVNQLASKSQANPRAKPPVVVVDVKKPFKTANLNNGNTMAVNKNKPKDVKATNVGANLRRAAANRPLHRSENDEEEFFDDVDNGEYTMNQDEEEEEENILDDENEEQFDQTDDADNEEFFGSQSPSVSPSPSHSSSVIHQNGFSATSQGGGGSGVGGGSSHERSKTAGSSNASSNMKHVCQICEKTFKTQNILRQHMRIHTGDKPFVCDLCSKAFSQMASLKYHLATHSDDRPFKCENCSKTFKLKPPFKKHIKECQPRHHGSSNSLYSQSNHNMSGVGVNQDFNDDE